MAIWGLRFVGFELGLGDRDVLFFEQRDGDGLDWRREKRASEMRGLLAVRVSAGANAASAGFASAAHGTAPVYPRLFFEGVHPKAYTYLYSYE